MKKNIDITQNIETLFGTRDENLHLLEEGLNVTIDLKADSVEIEGAARDVARAEQVFCDYDHLQRTGFVFNNGDLGSMLRVLGSDPTATLRGLAEAGRQRSFGKRTVQPKSVNQRRYVEAIEKNDMVFGIGPAGTGKTYLAVAMAISALVAKKVNRIILARPAVEAGERLGFLPGTLQEKVDPYLRPLYDALYDMMDPEKIDRYLEKNIIEIAPIAFMRGRTLNDSFIILDEAQNTTSEQMKMFVTRMGFNSKAVITGDITQVDLPNGRRSGLTLGSWYWTGDGSAFWYSGHLQGFHSELFRDTREGWTIVYTSNCTIKPWLQKGIVRAVRNVIAGAAPSLAPPANQPVPRNERTRLAGHWVMPDGEVIKHGGNVVVQVQAHLPGIAATVERDKDKLRVVAVGVNVAATELNAAPVFPPIDPKVLWQTSVAPLTGRQVDQSS